MAGKGLPFIAGVRHMRAMTKRLMTLRMTLALGAMLAYVALSLVMTAQQPVRAAASPFVAADICGDPDSDAHCPFCALAHAVLLPKPPQVPARDLRVLAGSGGVVGTCQVPEIHAPCPAARAPPLMLI